MTAGTILLAIFIACCLAALIYGLNQVARNVTDFRGDDE